MFVNHDMSCLAPAVSAMANWARGVRLGYISLDDSTGKVGPLRPSQAQAASTCSVFSSKRLLDCSFQSACSWASRKVSSCSCIMPWLSSALLLLLQLFIISVLHEMTQEHRMHEIRGGIWYMQ